METTDRETSDILALLESYIGVKCRVETRDGSIRNEIVRSLATLDISFPDVDGSSHMVSYPIALHFDEGEVDGVEITHIKEIRPTP